MSKENMFIALDPGITGFIALWSKSTDWIFYPMPTAKIPTGKLTKTGKVQMRSEFSIFELIKLMLEIRKKFSNFNFVIAIEDVHAIFGSSAKATFNFGEIVGIQKAALTLLNKDIIMISPKKWQSLMWKNVDIVKKPSQSGKTMVNDTKATSEAVARKLFPDMDFRKNKQCTEPDDNKIDALLICEFLKLKYKPIKN